MSANRYKPHILVLPEDDANRQMANGFHLKIDISRQRQFQILPVCGGWTKVRDRFTSEYIPYLKTHSSGYVILAIDFDENEGRLEEFKSEIPDGLKERVFVIGAWDEPEKIKLGSFETIGGLLAEDCQHGSRETWNHPMFNHNLDEVTRIRENICTIMF